MRIGIDIDGVLNSQYNFCIEYGTKFCSEMGKYHLENINAMDTTDMFGWSENIAHQFWNKYRIELAVNLKAKSFASEIIKRLKSDGNKIYIITARKNNDDWYPDNLCEVEKLTKKWLKENNILYDEIYFNVKDKGDFCKNNHIDIMIDDEPKNINSLMGKTQIIIFDYPYNRNKEYSNILRAYSWYDIYNKIKLLSSNNS